MKKQNNFYILDDQNLISNPNRNSQILNKGHWFIIENKEYYFKPVFNEYNAYKEIFASLVAKHLEIPSVTYYLGQFNNEIGVFSENFNPQHLPEISLSSILNYFIDNQVKNNTNYNIKDYHFNLDYLWEALSYFKDNVNNRFNLPKLMKELVDAFILQILLANGDLIPDNLTIIMDQEPHFSLNYDFEKMGVSKINGYINFCLQVIPQNELIMRPKDCLEDFLNYSDESFKNYFQTKLDKLPSSSLILQEMESLMNLKLNDKILQIAAIYDENCQNIKANFNKKL